MAKCPCCPAVHVTLPELESLREGLAVAESKARELDGVRASLREMIQQRDHAVGKVDALREALDTAVDFAGEGWSYANDYFRTKHKYGARMAKLAVAMQASLSQSSPAPSADLCVICSRTEAEHGPCLEFTRVQSKPEMPKETP